MIKVEFYVIFNQLFIIYKNSICDLVETSEIYNYVPLCLQYL